MSERKGAITFKGNAMTLMGNEIKVGTPAPDFKLVANDLSEKSLEDFAGKTIILSVVPSLDTPVCDLQTKRFNEEAAGLGDDCVVLTVSLDLPFAQKRGPGAPVESTHCKTNGNISGGQWCGRPYPPAATNRANWRFVTVWRST